MFYFLPTAIALVPSRVFMILQEFNTLVKLISSRKRVALHPHSAGGMASVGCSVLLALEDGPWLGGVLR